VRAIFRTKEHWERADWSDGVGGTCMAWIVCGGGSSMERWSRPPEKRPDGNQTAAGVEWVGGR
jgi:hypothetical protein